MADDPNAQPADPVQPAIPQQVDPAQAGGGEQTDYSQTGPLQQIQASGQPGNTATDVAGATVQLSAQQLDQIMSKPFDDHVSKGTDAVIKEAAAGGIHQAGGALTGATGDLDKGGKPGTSGTQGPPGDGPPGSSGGAQPPMGTKDWEKGPDGKPVIGPAKPGSTPQDVTSPKGLGTIGTNRGAAPSGKGSGVTVDGVDPFEKYDSADVREALTMSSRNIPKALAILKADAEQGQTRKSALDVAGAKATSAENVARMTGQNRLDIANVRVQGNIDVEGIKSAAAQQIATNKITNPGLAKQWDLLRGMAQGGASADVLNHQMQEMGINPKQFNAQQQQPAQQQGQQQDQGQPLPPGGQAALKKNTVYRLPNGPMTWTGTGFINQPKVAAPGGQ